MNFSRDEIFSNIQENKHMKGAYKRSITKGTAYYGNSKHLFPIHYKAFINLHARIYNSRKGLDKANCYKNINVSKEYEKSLRGIANFIADIGPIPENICKPSVDRIDHNKDYEPGNIQWLELGENSRESAIRNPISNRVSAKISRKNLLQGRRESSHVKIHEERTILCLLFIPFEKWIFQKEVTEMLKIRNSGDTIRFLDSLKRKDYFDYEVKKVGRSNLIRRKKPFPTHTGKIICVDFDSVLHEYKTPIKLHEQEKILDGVISGALEFCLEARKYFTLVILTARGAYPGGLQAAEMWLQDNGFPPMVVTDKKVPAVLYIDDRAYTFDGRNFPSIDFMKNFKPWNRNEDVWERE